MSEISDLSVGDLSELLRADADAIARSLLPAGRYEMGSTEWRCTGTNSPTGTTICVHVGSGDKQGICGFWNETPNGGDLIDLYQLIHGCSAREAVEWAKEWLGLDAAPATRLNMSHRRRREIETGRKERAANQAQSVARRTASASQIWKQSIPLQGLGAVYLSSRGIDPKYAGTELRYHSSLSYPAGGVFPAVVARVSNIDGRGVGIWRIYLKPTGEGKAPVDNPKLGLGECLGGAVRIGNLWTEIGIAEGVETALACRHFIHKTTNTMMPVWAALSTSGMKAITLPPEVRSVRIFADNDPIKFRSGKIVPSSGLSAAKELATRLKAAGLVVRIQEPPSGLDWLDVLNSVQNGKLATLEAIAA